MCTEYGCRDIFLFFSDREEGSLFFFFPDETRDYIQTLEVQQNPWEMLLETLFLLPAPACNIKCWIRYGRHRKAVAIEFILCLDYDIRPCSEMFLTSFSVTSLPVDVKMLFRQKWYCTMYQTTSLCWSCFMVSEVISNNYVTCRCSIKFSGKF